MAQQLETPRPRDRRFRNLHIVLNTWLDENEAQVENVNVNPLLVKMAWAFTFGIVMEQKPNLSVHLECNRRKLKGVAIFEKAQIPCEHADLIESHEEVRLGDRYAQRIFSLLERHISDEGISEVTDVVLNFCNMLAHNQDVHLARFDDALFRQRKLRQTIFDNVSILYGNKHVSPTEVLEQRHRPYVPEDPFPVHEKIDVAKVKVPPPFKRLAKRQSAFETASWDCCSLASANICLSSIYCLKSSPPSKCVTRRLIKLREKCIAILCEWISSHLDSKNTILVVCFVLGILARGNAFFLSRDNFNLSNLYIFATEMRERYKSHIEAYRGGRRQKNRFCRLLLNCLLPACSTDDLVNIQAFCNEIRLCLAKHVIASDFSRFAYVYMCKQNIDPSRHRNQELEMALPGLDVVRY